MRKNKLVSIVMVVIIICTMALATKNSLAAENQFKDLTETLYGNNTAGNSTAGNTTTGNNTTGNNTIKNNTTLTTNNTSNYNNTTLPDTGIESSVAGVVFVVVLAISGVYAYNKIQYYRDI